MLGQFFSPKSVAVVGAAREPGKVGYGVLQNIIDSGFKGRIYPINPKADAVLGLQCYSSIKAVRGKVDLAVLAIPRAAVLSTVAECGRKGVQGIIVLTAGFREVGPEGAALEKEVLSVARQYGIRLLGPNSLGLIDTHTPVNASFAAGMPVRGEISFMSQSGALCTAILDWALKEDLGFAKFISLGNKADVDEINLLDAWAEDPHTRVIISYLEGIGEGRKFMQAARAVTKKKPVVMVKSGVTAAGSRAVSSHTGSLAGSESAYNAAFKQSGVIRARSVEDLFNLSVAFSFQPLPRDSRLAIVTNAGGPGIIATDEAERQGLRLATFARSTIDKLRASLTSTANVYNPIDVIGDARSDRYRVAVDAALADPGVDALVVILTPQAMTEIEATANLVVELSRQYGKTVLASFMGGVRVEPGVRILREGSVPNYEFPEEAVASLGAMYEQRRWIEKPVEQPMSFPVRKEQARRLLVSAAADKRQTLGDVEARGVLTAYGFKVPTAMLARSAEQAIGFAKQIGYPVVLKVVSPEILHKSDVGGVVVGLQNDEEVGDAYETILARVRRFMPKAVVWGVEVQEMVTSGKETIIGLVKDPQFGHMLMFGLGGIYVEVLKDVSFRITPLTLSDAREMISQIRSYPLLAGVRGEKPVDIDAIVDALLRLSQLAEDFPQISELDINPLRVRERGQGAVAVDCRLAFAPDGLVEQVGASGRSPLQEQVAAS
ncbi:MAG: acetate--CoA ligase family protein [Chloroflexi bacterium]|nr:acetate--CoA ligase family protein [Chloroflexota bacterium]